MNTNLNECKRIMNGLFMFFMVNNVLRDHQKTLDGLHSVIKYMERTFSLNQTEQHEVLRVFWNEYAKGTAGQVTETYINKTMIPSVYSIGRADISLGGEFVSLIKERLGH